MMLAWPMNSTVAAFAMDSTNAAAMIKMVRRGDKQTTFPRPGKIVNQWAPKARELLEFGTNS
jgi:hypothetical protein